MKLIATQLVKTYVKHDKNDAADAEALCEAIRLRPERPNHVRCYDFVQDRTHDGRSYRILVILDEFSLEALMICVARKLDSTDVLDALIDLIILRGPPEYIRSDNVLCRERIAA